MKKILIYCIFSLLIILSSNTVHAAQMQGGALTGEVKLTADTTLTSTINIPANGSLILDLNGYVLEHYNDERPIIVSAGATLTIKDSTPNRSHYGTVTNNLWVYNSSATSGVEIKGGIITGGVKSDRGGAIFNNGSVIMEGGTIAGCKTIANSNANENDMTNYPVNTYTNGTGGAIFINEGASFTMNGGAIKYCKAEVNSKATKSGGGAVFVDANADKVGTFTMNGGIISNCQALNGGAVYVHSNITTGNTLKTASIFNMNGGEISNCSSSGAGEYCGGGAVFVNATPEGEGAVESVATFNMSAGELKNNSTKGMGGAVYTLGKFTMSSKAKLTGNCTNNIGELVDGKYSYKGYGGAVFTTAKHAYFQMDGGTISDSIAASGGAIMVWNESTFTMNEGTISNSSSQGTGGLGNGGAVYVQAATFNFNAGTLEGNWARRYGGAININKTANLYLNGACNILNNTANHGGGISQEDGDCQVRLDNENILIKGNKASNGNGGGLFVEKGILDINACTIMENTAENNGGGIALRVERIGGDITVNMTGGTIKKNTAKANGGGIDVYADHDFTEDDTSEDANKQNDVVVNIKAGILEDNNADGNGAGINIYVNENNGTAMMNIGDETNLAGPEIVGNTSLNDGGGICINGGSINMKAGNINNCTANEGGGVYISGGDMQINGGQINGGQATAGGGIYISNGNITMNGGTLSNNQATLYGGGIYASSETQNLNITITSGTITGNIANGHGGGVGVNVGEGLSATVIIGLETCNGTDENHSHPIILDNTASQKGGGFCLHGDDLSMTMYCGSINGNIAIREPGSSNINQTGGKVTVHGGTVSGGITIIGGEYTYVPGDLSKVGVTYNSNISGEIEQAEITPGVVISLPKTIFTREGYTLVGWSTSQSPGQSDKVYATGELYTIPNESVILYAIWLREGAGSVETPAVKSGKIYEEFTGGINVMITCDSAFTSLMSVLDIQPNLYTNRTLSFSNSLKSGTTIMMIDLSNESDRGYYYYKVKDDTTIDIPLEAFIKMGQTTNQTNYVNSEISDVINEKFIFIVDFANSNTTTSSTQMKLTRYSADSEVAQIEQTISYTTTAQRNFNFTWTNRPAEEEKISLNDTFSLSYEESMPTGEDSRYNGKNLILVIEGSDTSIPLESKLYDGTNYYELNRNGKFIIPFGNIVENRNITLKLISESLLANGHGCNLKAELWTTKNNDETKPFMGDKVATIDSISLAAIPLPAFKVDMNKRLYRTYEFNGNIEVNYEAENIENYNVTLEIQKKNENNTYETQTNIVSSVTKATSSENGVFLLEVSESEKLKIEFVNNTNLNPETYRVLVKVLDEDEVRYTIPYNFMILD